MGTLPQELASQIHKLSQEQLEELSELTSTLNSFDDLRNWLEERA